MCEGWLSLHVFLKYEFLKGKGRFVFLSLCLTGLLLCYFLYTGWYLSTVDFPAKQRTAYSAKAIQLEKNVGNYLGKNDIPAEAAKKVAANLDAQKKLLSAMIAANVNGDWKLELDNSVEQLKLEQSLTSLGALPDNPDIPIKLKENLYFQKHGIKPKESVSACDGLNVVVMISNQFLPALTPICALLFSLSAWLSEKRSGSLKLLLWQARPKRKILIDKAIVTWVESTAALAASSFMTFLICWAAFGFGSANYPLFAAEGQILLTGSVIAKAATALPIKTLVLATVCNLLAGLAVLKA